MSETHKFKCGCEIPIINGIPQVDFNNLNLSCEKAWNVYHNGQTQSVFQLEKYLGKHWSKKLKPSSIEDAAALISVIRPGTLNSHDENGRSMTDVYCDRVNGLEELDKSNPLYEILKNTQLTIIYQESIMEICAKIAGFDGKKQMKLLKGIGKKKAEIIAECKSMFIDGCKQTGMVSEQTAEFIFGQIEASARYSFNKCILGNQKLKGISQNIEELFNNKNYDYALSMTKDNKIIKNKIVNIQEAGIRQCYIIETESGKKCEVTDNHKFPTPNGNIEVKNLKIGDDLYIAEEFGVYLEKINAITLGSTGMTYDITMEAPNHNYVTSDGIVTCNSHAVSYAILGYWTAWVKSHLPYHYLCAWLINSKNEAKQLDEIRAIISESRRLNIPIRPPSIKNLPETDFFINNKNIYFGLSSIKNCGEASFAKIIEEDCKDSDWLEFLILHSNKVNKKNMISMIRVGCFDHTGYSRMNCEFEFNQWSVLSPTEKRKCTELFINGNYCTLLELIKKLVEDKLPTKTRMPTVQSIVDTLENPPYEIKDSIDNIVANEKELLGINISCTKIQKQNVPNVFNKCKEASDGLIEMPILVGEISETNEFVIKNGKLVGQTMASFKIVDESGECDCVCFPSQLDKYQSAVYDGNLVMILGQRSNQNVIVNELYEV